MSAETEKQMAARLRREVYTAAAEPLKVAGEMRRAAENVRRGHVWLGSVMSSALVSWAERLEASAQARGEQP